jgi:hypothetical protein
MDSEQVERDKLTAKYEDDTSVEREAYELATLPAHQKAEALLAPIKAQCDSDVKEIIARTKRIIDKRVAKFSKEQDAIQKAYDASTKVERQAYDEKTAQKRAAYEETVQKVGETTQNLIKPINEEYRALAEQLDKVTNAHLLPTY